MKYVEMLEEMRNQIADNSFSTADACVCVEKKLVDQTCQQLLGTDVKSQLYGSGKVTEIEGNTLGTIILSLAFDDTLKKFSLAQVIKTNFLFVKFDNEELCSALCSAYSLHIELDKLQKNFKLVERQQEVEAKKKAEEQAKAEAKYLKHKEMAIKEFNEQLAKVNTSLNATDDFYYALGWLTKHVGTISAALPDYLLQYFEKHFGTDANPRVVDSRKRTSGGFSYQWALGMRASIVKNKGNIPSMLLERLNPTGNAITDTSFIWELIDNYGFKFGKKQEEDRIKQMIPAQYISSFEAGLVA